MLLGLHRWLRLERMNEMGMMKAAPRDKHILPHLYNGYFSPASSVLPVVPSRSRTSRIVNPPLRRVTCRRAQDLIKCIGRGPDQKLSNWRGSYRKNQLQSLGSNISFLDIQVAKWNKLLITRTLPMIITVANGQKMTSEGKCIGIKWGRNSISY